MLFFESNIQSLPKVFFAPEFVTKDTFVTKIYYVYKKPYFKISLNTIGKILNNFYLFTIMLCLFYPIQPNLLFIFVKVSSLNIFKR